MAIVTDQTITVHGVSIGISKPIQTLIADGDFTYEELSKFAIVGRHDFVNDVAGIFEPDTYSYMAGSSAVISALGKYPVCNDPTLPNWSDIGYEYFGKGNRVYDNYGKMVLVYNMTSSVNNINKNFNDSNTACIVTEFNPRLIKMMGTINAYTETATVGEPGTYTRYDVEASRNFVWFDDDTTAPFACLCIQNFEDGVYFDFPLYDNVYTANQTIAGNRDSMYVQLPYDFDDYMQTGNKLLSVWAGDGIEDFMQGANYSNSFFGVNDLSNDRGSKIICVSYTAYPDYNAIAFVRPSDLDTALKQLAGCGFYFEANGTVYKPITEDGIVTGYTADLSKNGQWDLINDVTGNTVPDTPPSPTPPTPSGDDYTDMELGLYNGKMGGLTKFAIMSTQELVDLIIDYNTNAANAGSNFSNHIICLYRLGINPALLTTAGSGKIVMIKSAGDVDFESQANYSLVTDQATFIDCGSITVPRNTGTFYDFSPYTSYELYIPGCGWIPLPDNVAGRTIRAYIIFDFPSCSAKGIVRIEGDGLLTYGTTIATVNGVIGAPVPFTIGENGQQRAGIMSANAQVAAGIATGLVGGALGNPYMMVSGGSNLVGGLISAYTAGNTNYVSTKGGAADFSMFGDGGKAILKINSPVVDSVVTKPLFGHSVGYMCNELGTLSNFHGFTVCTNPHVHINATSTEKEEIKQLLEEGVILP